ncbi:MAG: hypothetical protein WAN50_01860 [Minisyncoccia bacterium]
MSQPQRLPESISKWTDPFVLCFAAIAVYCVFSGTSISNEALSILIVATIIVVMMAIEWLRGPKHTFKYSIRQCLPHSAITWLGTLAGLAVILAAWGTLAEYQNAYYAPFFQMLPLILIAAPAVSAFFILAADCIYGPSMRGGYQLGLVVLGRTREVDWHAVRDDIIMWLIRGFFLPINFCELVWSIGMFRGNELSLLQNSFAAGEYYLLVMVYALIIAAVTPGYLFGSRLIRTETKAVSHSWFGWMVTLACYQPFEAAFFVSWFDYNPTVPNPVWMQPWVTHLQNVPFALAAVGGAILLFSFVHLWGEAQFGLRSSNLSNRGIITTGPFRICKHPIYASKCMVWLLIWLPFVSGVNLFDDVRLAILFACICGIYCMRSLAEEELLSADPDYVAYALWMDEHGLSKKLSEFFPPLSFAWRLAYWQKSSVPRAEAA